MRSSSIRETPGRAASRTASWTAATQAPARAIFSNSRLLLIVVMSRVREDRLRRSGRSLRGERREDALGDLSDAADTGDPDPWASRAGPVQQGLALVAVAVAPVPDRVLGVVGATPGEHPLDQCLLVHLEDHDPVEAARAEQLVEGNGLTGGAGEAVEDEPAGRVGLGDPLLQH